MRVGIIGSGRIGGNLGTLLARAGHEVLFSFSRDPEKLQAMAEAAGGSARAATPAEAAASEVVVLSVPWSAIDQALAEAGPLEDRVVIDTTNPFTERGLEKPEGVTSARFNQRRIPGARLVKAFSTLTAGFQQASARRGGEDRVVVFFATDDERAADVASRIIQDAGFTPAQVGGLDDSELMEAPRREGAVYGEEYHAPQAATVVELWRARPPGRKTGSSFVQRYIRAFGTADYEALRQLYDEDVRFYTPLAWGAQGWEFLRSFIQELHRGYPGLKVTLHDEFYSADGSRACFRFVLHWHHAGPFFGHAATGERGTMSETHAIRLRNGRIVEQWVGDNSFQMPHQELVEFGMDFPRDTPDPVPPILTVESQSAAQTAVSSAPSAP